MKYTVLSRSLRHTMTGIDGDTNRQNSLSSRETRLEPRLGKKNKKTPGCFILLQVVCLFPLSTTRMFLKHLACRHTVLYPVQSIQ